MTNSKNISVPLRVYIKGMSPLILFLLMGVLIIFNTSIFLYETEGDCLGSFLKIIEAKPTTRPEIAGLLTSKSQYALGAAHMLEAFFGILLFGLCFLRFKSEWRNLMSQTTWHYRKQQKRNSKCLFSFQFRSHAWVPFTTLNILILGSLLWIVYCSPEILEPGSSGVLEKTIFKDLSASGKQTTEDPCESGKQSTEDLSASSKQTTADKSEPDMRTTGTFFAIALASVSIIWLILLYAIVASLILYVSISTRHLDRRQISNGSVSPSKNKYGVLQPRAAKAVRPKTLGVQPSLPLGHVSGQSSATTFTAVARVLSWSKLPLILLSLMLFFRLISLSILYDWASKYGLTPTDKEHIHDFGNMLIFLIAVGTGLTIFSINIPLFVVSFFDFEGDKRGGPIPQKLASFFQDYGYSFSSVWTQPQVIALLAPLLAAPVMDILRTVFSTTAN